MPFIEFSTAFSFDFGRKRQDSISVEDLEGLEIVESEANTEVVANDSRIRIGFQPNDTEE